MEWSLLLLEEKTIMSLDFWQASLFWHQGSRPALTINPKILILTQNHWSYSLLEIYWLCVWMCIVYIISNIFYLNIYCTKLESLFGWANIQKVIQTLQVTSMTIVRTAIQQVLAG